MNDFHTSVLQDEVIVWLNVQSGKKYIDATLGGGGHSLEIVERGAIVLGIDTDEEAIEHVEKNLKSQISNLKLIVALGNFRDIGKIAKENGFEKVDGILFDLGVSSYQFDNPERGFSFQKSGPLDMRMDKNLSVTAGDLLNALGKGELDELFHTFGEEYNTVAISRGILRARQIKPIETTDELTRIIEEARGIRGGAKGAKLKAKINARFFQALRIAVNDELKSLEESLPQAVDILGRHGRLVVISFHSLEDRIVKNMFKDFEKKSKGSVLTKKPIVPTELEIEKNWRSRSAKMRVFEKF